MFDSERINTNSKKRIGTGKGALHLKSLTEEDLLALHDQVIKKINDLKSQNRLHQISQFKMRDIVNFPNEGQKQEGVIIRINQNGICDDNVH